MVKATATMDVMRIFMVLFFVDLRLFVGLHPFTGEAREILDLLLRNWFYGEGRWKKWRKDQRRGKEGCCLKSQLSFLNGVLIWMGYAFRPQLVASKRGLCCWIIATPAAGAAHPRPKEMRGESHAAGYGISATGNDRGNPRHDPVRRKPHGIVEKEQRGGGGEDQADAYYGAAGGLSAASFWRAFRHRAS